ncbi:RNA polymerase II mediator complex subunit [Pseudogymnoascus destructans]|uniref:Mediator of RNA polymerase II transcription subunit 17 n=1 Tax=Pseudogymnoascus destructans TaxID=655981 RepID=A0A177A8P7_9PEZI|nr:RNA polymerase II mediator complex subunit [Pseudogymnoascus destructans]OAF58526.1 RNA polymerase II mediator complex subunit [Pseudogymnoascus destructans]
MSGIPHNFPMSLRPWPTKEGNGSALPTLISRINAERGQFRNLTEEGLREEIAKGENEAAADNEDVSTEDETEAAPDRQKEVMDAKAEMLAQLEQAHHASMIALDFVALLLSKDQPVQAGLSISDGLRHVVSLGTLGADRVKDTRLTEPRKKDIAAVGKGWKIQSFNTSVESILNAASRLETEIAAETKYWEAILSVDEKGWKTCKLPQEQHTLGVRFGFFDAAPAFSNRSLAALRRQPDGTAYLDHGAADPTPKRVLIHIETNGVLTGALAPETSAPDSSSLETLVLRSRNAIFEEELWQELNREARTLANHSVRMTGDEISCQLTPSTRILLRLEPLSTSPPTTTPQPRAHDDIATMLSLALHLELSYAHRQNQRRRTQPPPPISSAPRPNPPYALLRPLLAYEHHIGVLAALRATTASLTTTLCAASLTVPAATLLPATPTPATSTEERVAALLSSREAEFLVPLPANQSVTIKLRSDLGIQTRFRIEITPALAAVCRAPPNPSVEEVRTFLWWAAGCAVVRAVVEKGEEAGVGEGLKGWKEMASPCLVSKEAGGRSREIGVVVVEGRLGLKVKSGKGNRVVGWGVGGEERGVWEVVEEVGRSDGTEGAWGDGHEVIREVTEIE